MPSTFKCFCLCHPQIFLICPVTVTHESCGTPAQAHIHNAHGVTMVSNARTMIRTMQRTGTRVWLHVVSRIADAAACKRWFIVLACGALDAPAAALYTDIIRLSVHSRGIVMHKA